MTYKQLLEKISKYENFDPIYSTNNLTVKECFHNDYILYTDTNLRWYDQADNYSINELLKLEFES